MPRNILVISPVPTHPPSAGNRARILMLTQALRESGHRVDFMHVLKEDGDEAAMRRFWGGHYLRVPYRKKPPALRRRWRKVARRLRLDSGYTYGLDEWYADSIDEAVDGFTARLPVDTVLVNYVFLSRALLRFPDTTLKVLDTHDQFANRHRRYLRENQTPAWYSCSTRAQRRGFDRADIVLAIQHEEAERFKVGVSAQVEVVGHLTPLRRLPSQQIVRGRILLVGSDNPINVAALNWFRQYVMPRIRLPGGRCELAAAGTICRRVDGMPGVRMLGELDDLADAYGEAQVVVNPMQFGTGLKIKSLEALAHGRALVTTPVGAAGLELGVGSAFLVADDAEGFARHIHRLLADRRSAEAFGAAGFAFASSYHAAVCQAVQSIFGSSRQVGAAS